MALFSRPKVDPEPEPATPPPPAPVVNRLPGAPEPTSNGLRGIDEHRDFLLSMVGEMRPFGIGLAEASGLSLCEALTSDLDLPICSAASVDGWAVRAADLTGASEGRPVTLPIVGQVRPGDPAMSLTPGNAIWVSASAPLPEGADAVVPVAFGVVNSGQVEFRVEARFPQTLRLAGSRVADGDPLLGRGVMLTPRALGLIAEVGHDKVLARPRPRVAVITAGSGIIPPGLPLTRLDERYDATSTLVGACLRQDGAQVYGSGIISPHPPMVANAISEQLVRSDMVVLIADDDPQLLYGLAGLGGFDVAMVDGFDRPLTFGLIGPDRVPLLVLPLAAVAAYLAYQLFGRPLVERLGGRELSEPELIDSHLSTPLDTHPQQTRFVLANSGPAGVRPMPYSVDQGAAELADANAVIILPAGEGTLPTGSGVVCWVLE